MNMIHSTAFRLSSRSTNRLFSRLGLQRNSVSTAGQCSWIGTLSDKTTNAFSVSNTRPQSLDFLYGRSRLSPCMFSTSPNASVSKKQDDDNNNNSEITKAVEEKPKTSFRQMVQRYGKVFIGTYLGVYVTTCLGLFMSVQSGHIDAMYMISLLTGTATPTDPGGVADPETIKEAAATIQDLVHLLEGYTITRPVAPMVEEYPWTANFAIAWIATKFTEPIRFGITVVLTPPVARFLGYRPKKGDTAEGDKVKER